MKKARISNLKYAAAPLALGLALVSAPAFAQAEPAADEEPADEQIVVTGSLITSNPNLEAAVPVNVVTEKEIELQQANVAEELLRELPGAVPSVGSAVNNGNGGASFVNLRNLGSNRNLVLIDGVRLVPAELNGRFDLNNIPLALISRVDVLTGGASTTYGADAVAGVVNFITKSDFAGFDATLSEQITELGDGNVFRGDVTMGANFDDGRGNAVLSIGYQKADAVYQGARDFSVAGLSSTTGAGGGSGTAVPTRFSLPDPDGAGPIQGGTFQVNPAGTAFLPTTAFTAFNFNPYNVFQTPFKRYNIFAAARYQVSDAVEVYTRGLFSKNTVETIIAPSGAFALQVSLPLNNPFLTTDLRNSFCVANGISAADCTAAANPALRPGQAGYRAVDTLLSRRATEVGPRISSYDTQIFDYRLGAKGSLTDSIDWDIFGSYGESDNIQTIQGYTLNSRVRQSVLAAGGVCFTATNGCTPINWFGPEGSITAAQVDFLNENSTVRTKTSLGQVRATINGDFGGFTMPWAGEAVAFAVGGEYRTYHASQASDTLAQSGDLGGSGGAALNINGGFNVYEAFGELVIPIVQDRPLFHDLTIEGGIRYSSYSVDAPTNPQYDTTTWKVGGSWSPVEQLKFRGNYSRAVRAPNIAELFSPVNTLLTNLTDDPCATRNGVGAVIRPNPTGELLAVCLAQGANAGNVNSIAVPTSGQANYTGGGNLNVLPEVSNSWSVGAVVQPLDGLSFSVDYFHIKVTGAITSPTSGDAIAACFGTATGGGTNPTYTPAAGASTSAACTQIRRNPLSGSLSGDPATTGGLFLSQSNLGTLETSGVDFTANYNTDLGFAGLALNGVLTYTHESKFRATPAATSINRDCVGFYSANCGQPIPKWLWSMRSTLTVDEIDISLVWRHISAVRLETGTFFSGTLPASTGPIAGKVVDFNRISAHNYFDLTTRFAVTDNFSLTLAVQNLLNQEPPLVGSEAGSTSFNSGNTFPSTYDALGRRFVATARLRF